MGCYKCVKSTYYLNGVISYIKSPCHNMTVMLYQSVLFCVRWPGALDLYKYNMSQIYTCIDGFIYMADIDMCYVYKPGSFAK